MRANGRIKKFLQQILITRRTTAAKPFALSDFAFFSSKYLRDTESDALMTITSHSIAKNCNGRIRRALTYENKLLFFFFNAAPAGSILIERGFQNLSKARRCGGSFRCRAEYSVIISRGEYIEYIHLILFFTRNVCINKY